MLIVEGQLRLPALSRRKSLIFVLILHAVALSIIASWAWLTFEPSTFRFDIPASEIGSETGQAAITVLHLPTSPWIQFRSDISDNGSNLKLFENGIQIGPAHSIHAQIRQLGGGRFSHWGSSLVFSSSDGSNAATNDKRYMVEVSSEPSLLVKAAALGAVLLVSGWHVRTKRRGEILHFLTLAPSAMLFGGYRTALVVLMSVGISAMLMWRIVNSGVSTGLAVGSWFPINDAFNWWACGVNVAWVGNFSNFTQDWCERRPIYEVLLGGLDLLGGASTRPLIWLQAALVGAAIAWFARDAVRVAGLLGGALATTSVLWFCQEFAFGQLMSENAGLIFGLPSLALLMSGGDRRDLRVVAIGIAGLSIALTARLGAMFVLPLLILWSGFSAWRWQQSMVRVVSMCLLAAAAGPLLQIVLISITGGHLQDSGSNLAQTLYGLSTGGRNWVSARADHPELFAAHRTERDIADILYNYAYKNIKLNPLLFLNGMLQSFNLWKLQLLNYSPPTFHLLLYYYLLPAGLITLIWRIRQKSAQILVLVFLGEAATAPFGYSDAGNRVMAATIAVDGLIVGFGLQGLANIVTRVLGIRNALLFAVPTASSRGGVVFLAGLSVLMLLPISRRLVDAPSPIEQPAGCMTGLTAARVSLDRAFVLRTAPQDAAVVPFETLPNSAFDGLHWYDPEFAALAAGTVVLQSLPLHQTPLMADVIWPDAPLFSPGDSFDLCFDQHDTVTLAAISFAKVKSWHRVPGPSPQLSGD